MSKKLTIAVIAGIFVVIAALIGVGGNIVGAVATVWAAIINAGAKPTPPLVSSPSQAVTASPSPTPDVPLPRTATVYRNSLGTLFIDASYDPPQLRSGEKLCFEASTRQSFDESPLLVPRSEIEFVPKGSMQGRLVYDPGDQPVWYRFLIIDAQGKPCYGKAAIAKKP